MGNMSREKGKRGEREVAAIISDLLGVSASRRVRQHDGDSDILGVPGWSIEVKRCEKAIPSDLRRWWEQACRQSVEIGGHPALFYRQDRHRWRVIWPLSVVMGLPKGALWTYFEYAVESDPEAWAAVVRECWMHEHVQADAAHPQQPACRLLKVEEPA